MSTRMSVRHRSTRAKRSVTSKADLRNGRYDYYQDDFKGFDTVNESRHTPDVVAHSADIEATGNMTAFYGVKSLKNSKRIFGDDRFNLTQHMNELFAEVTTGDIDDVLQYLKDAKDQTSHFLSNKVKTQYTEFIAMSRNVLEIEDQMTEMDDMLKSMSGSMKNLHETKFMMLQRLASQSAGQHKNAVDEEQRDREQQEIEALESMHEQIATHIQLRQLQQATDLIVTARNGQVHLKASARKRAMNFINSHIHELESLIVEQLSSQAYLPDLKRDKLSTLLMKLGFVDQAMELFLGHKSKALKATIRQISLYGDVKQYIQDLSKVFFDDIINTTLQFTNLLNKIELVDSDQREEEQEMKAMAEKDSENAFATAMNMTMSKGAASSYTNPFDGADEMDKKKKKNKSSKKLLSKPKKAATKAMAQVQRFSYKNSMHMSRLMVWIYKELETYEKLFEQQVFQLEQNDFKTIGECLRIVFKQSTRLDQSGIHVSFLLSNHFQSSIETAINRLYKRKLEAIKKLSRRENFVSKSKNVSNPGDKAQIMNRGTRGLSNARLFNKKPLAPAKNPFTSTDRKRTATRYRQLSQMVANNAQKTQHNRRTSEIFGDVLNADGSKREPSTRIDDEQSLMDSVDDDDKKLSLHATPSNSNIGPAPTPSDDENMAELKQLSQQRRRSRTKSEIARALQLRSDASNNLGAGDGSGGGTGLSPMPGYTVVKLTKSGSDMYEIVKKSIQETCRLLDQRYYSELTKSVYRTVVTQMIFLVQVYSSQITSEINHRAPKELTTYRKSQTAGSSSSSSKSKKHRRRSSNAPTTSVATINENEQFGDDEKSGLSTPAKKDQLHMPGSGSGSSSTVSSSSSRNKGILMQNGAVPKVLNEAQMLSLIANVYYVSEDLLTRIASRYQKLFGREIPELQLFSIEQQKLFKAQFTQFAKKFLYTWVNEKLQWTDDQICAIYGEKSDVSIVTKEEISSWSVSTEILGFVRYIVNLRLEIDKYLGDNKDVVILRECIEVLLTELFHGDYIPTVNINESNDDSERVLISPHGLNKLYLDFRFLMITLHNFMSSASKNLCTSICDKAKQYVNYKYNLLLDVDWKLMHTLGMKLQYKVLSGDELDVLNKASLSGPASVSSATLALTSKKMLPETPELSDDETPTPVAAN